MKEKEYEGLSISKDDDGDYKLQFYDEGPKVSDFLICKKRMEQLASMIFIHKACEWLKKNLPQAMVRSDYYMFNGEFIKDFKNAMEGGEQ